MNVEVMKMLWLLLSVILVPIVILYFYQFRKFIDVLKENHHDVWVELGKFSMIKNNSIGNSSKISMYLLRKKFEDIDDIHLIQAGSSCRKLLIAGLILAAIIFFVPIIAGQI